MENRDQYVEKMKAKLDELNLEIKKLEAKAQGAKADAQIKYSDEIETIKKNRDDAAEKLKEMQSAGGEAWKDLKIGFDASWSILEDAFKSAKSRFK